MNKYETILVVDDNASILTAMRYLLDGTFEQVQTPVVLLTAYADVSLAVKGLKNGAADFITKPSTAPPSHSN